MSIDPDYDLTIKTFTDIWPRYVKLGFHNLTEPEQVIFCTWPFDCEVNNGGFHQYFNNSSGELAVETVAALEKVKMPFAASLLRRALAGFPNHRPEKDHDRRIKQLWSLPPEIQNELFNELTGQYFDSSEYQYLLQANYIRTHRGDFPGSSLEELRQALANIAMPAETQVRLFTAKDSAATELVKAFEAAHSSADVPRAEWLPAKTRQAIDELAYHLAMCNPLMYADYPVDDRSDKFLRDSDFWAEARERAREALELLDSEPEKTDIQS